MKEKNPFNLDVVSVRLVKDAPIMSGHPITKPEDAVLLLGKHLCEMDREVLCVINMKTDGTPINCHFASIGCLNESMAHPREIFKASILSNVVFFLFLFFSFQCSDNNAYAQSSKWKSYTKQA